MSARRAILALLLLFAALAPAQAVERILLFVSDVQVERNGDLLVTETIRVQAELNNIRRGILRDFPTTYTRDDGTRVIVGFDVQSVTRDDASEPFATEPMSNGVRVRIGNADQTLSFGPHEYVIRYRTTRQIGFYADFDELYWNATGTGWTFAIDVAEARINLPERVAFGQNAFYTGPQGANGKDASVVEQQPGRIVFRTTRALLPGNGLTVAASWQKGLVSPPSGTQQASWWLNDNPAAAIAVIGLPLLLGFYLFAWLRVGRDPPSGTIIPLFGPPEGMSAAAVRYVENMAFDDRCFTAAIVGLGVSGNLKIVGDAKQQVLEARPGGREVAPDERAVKTNLFASKQSLELDQVNHETLIKAKTALWDNLKAAYLGKLFANNFAWSGIGLLLTVVLVVAMVFGISATHTSDDLGALIIGMLLPLLFIMGGASAVYKGWSRDSGGWWLIIGGALVVVIAALIGFVIMLTGARGPLDLLPGVAAFALAAISGPAFSLLQAPTVTGRAVMDRIEGFRQYLGVAEEGRLEALNSPDKTPELFEKFLPYAIALDVQNTWAKRFAGVLAAAGATAAASAWYSGNRDWTNDPVAFADHLGSSLNQTIASASTPPGSSSSDSSSSGSSGGGSSGGGGGGGGGSGW